MTDSAGVRIRNATSADLGAIRAIETAAFEPSRRSSVRALQRALGSRFQQVRVLELDGRVAGFIVVWPFRRTWRVYNLATDPAWRNRGVAGALLAAAETAAVAHGARQLVLESQPGGALERFYQQRGFHPGPRLPDYYAPGQDAVRMERRLRPQDDRRSP